MPQKLLDLALRGIAAAVLLPVGYFKVIADSGSVALFTSLGMEPYGRVIIGLIEICAGLLLISPAPAPGALLAFSVMLGAIIAHTTEIGFDIGDGGFHVGLLVVVLVSSVLVLVRHRGSLPLVGSTLQSDA